MRLELMGFHALHILADSHDPIHVHRALGQSVFVEESLKRLAVERVVNHLIEPAPYVLLVVIAHRLDEQFAQGFVIESQFA